MKSIILYCHLFYYCIVLSCCTYVYSYVAYFCRFLYVNKSSFKKTTKKTTDNNIILNQVRYKTNCIGNNTCAHYRIHYHRYPSIPLDRTPSPLPTIQHTLMFVSTLHIRFSNPVYSTTENPPIIIMSRSVVIVQISRRFVCSSFFLGK